MKKDSDVKYCKNKNCNKELPFDYKHKYCEACRNQHAQVFKNVGKGVCGVALTVATGAVVVLTRGKIDLRK